MKFQNTGRKKEYSMEDRYNNLWNQEAVSSYKLLKNHSSAQINTFFFSKNPPVDNLVKKYCDGVSTIVNNLSRQIDLFEDKEYVKAYIENTKQIALADLQEIMGTITLSTESINYINDIRVLLQDKKTEETWDEDIVMGNLDSGTLDQIDDIERFFSGNDIPSTF